MDIMEFTGCCMHLHNKKNFRCSDLEISYLFERMALGDFGINLTENKGKNDTNITTVNPCTEDYNYTSSPNQTAFMEDHQPQGQTIWLPITIAVAVVLVIGLFAIVVIVVKKRKLNSVRMMGLIGWLSRVRGSISSYFNCYGEPKDHSNDMERMPTEERLLPEDNTSKANIAG
ncbi:uncharacterized protein LOC111110634 isoform X2 [Crassostrea virginica]